MSTGNYPFPTLNGTNLLDQIIAPKIVWDGSKGYNVQADLGNLDTIYSRNIGSTEIPINQIYSKKIGSTGTKVSNLYVETIGSTGTTGLTGGRVSDIYVDTLHYLNLDPIITGGGTAIGFGNTGPTGPQGATGATGVTGLAGLSGIGVSGTTLSNGNLIFTYTNGSTANVGYIQGPIGPTGTIVKIGPTTTLGPGQKAYVKSIPGDNNSINLSFGIPQGIQGPRGPPGGSGGTGGGESFSGTTGQLLFYGGSDGITSSSLINYNSDLQTLFVPTIDIKGLDLDIPASLANSALRITSDGQSSYLQTFDPAHAPSKLIISGFLGSDILSHFDTQNKMISINKELASITEEFQPTLDVQGQTRITFDQTDSITNTTYTPYYGPTGQTISLGPSEYPYKIYGWGEGGIGPNALAGGEIEFELTVTGSTANVNFLWQGGGTGSSGYNGGNALFINININGNTQQYIAYGGGGGWDPADPTDSTAGQNAGITYAGAGGEEPLGVTGTPQIYTLTSGTTFNSKFNNVILNGITGISGNNGIILPSTTIITFDNPNDIINYGGPVNINSDGTPGGVTGPGAIWQYAQIKPNTTCNIDLHYYDSNNGSTSNNPALLNANINLPYSLLELTGLTGNSSGFYLDAGSSGSTENIILSSSTSVISPGQKGVNGNGLANILPTGINISGSSVNLYGITGFSSQTINWKGTGSITFGSTGYMYFSNSIIKDNSETIQFNQNQPSLFFKFYGSNIISATDIEVSSLNIPSGQTGYISVIGYGGYIYADSGTLNNGGKGLNGGGGGGGLFGGGGGINNIGGNGSSTGINGTTINNSISIYPYTNKYNNTSNSIPYGSSNKPGMLIIENTVSSTVLGSTSSPYQQKPALIINGNLEVCNNNNGPSGTIGSSFIKMPCGNGFNYLNTHGIDDKISLSANCYLGNDDQFYIHNYAGPAAYLGVGSNDGTNSGYVTIHTTQGAPGPTTTPIDASLIQRLSINSTEFNVIGGNIGIPYVNLVSGTLQTWNTIQKDGGGMSEFINYRGLGPGGFGFYSGATFNVDITDSTTLFTIDSSGNVIAEGSVTSKGDVNCQNLNAQGDVTAYSDIRLKENIENIDSALDKVLKMHGVYYTKKNNKERKVGIIAQEVEEVLPEVVYTDEVGMKSVSYGNIVALLIEAIKEQQKMIEELKTNPHLSK